MTTADFSVMSLDHDLGTPKDMVQVWRNRIDRHSQAHNGVISPQIFRSFVENKIWTCRIKAEALHAAFHLCITNHLINS